MSFRIEGPLTPESERALVQGLLAGDEDAVRVVYGRFARPVFSLGLRMLGSPEAAEELTQDVFVSVWRKAGRFDESRGRLSTWLMTVAHNLAVDRLRHDRGSHRASLVLVEEMPEPVVEGDEEAVVDRDAARRALASLSEMEDKLLRLAYFEGWTAREIAEADGIPLGTVKTRLRAALMKLRRTQPGTRGE